MCLGFVVIPVLGLLYQCFQDCFFGLSEKNKLYAGGGGLSLAVYTIEGF